MRTTKTSLCLSFCFLIAYFSLWYILPVRNHAEVTHFIEEWNANTHMPYRIEHEGITITRSLWSSPLKSTVAIHKMKLLFKDNSTTITSNADLELSKWLFSERTTTILPNSPPAMAPQERLRKHFAFTENRFRSNLVNSH